MPHTLPDLSYSVDSLEPHIDARTMEIHHGKHHQTYINNLNAALEGNTTLAEKPVNELIADLSQIPEGIRGAVRNNGGGHSNHTFFWEVISPSGGGIPSG
ncbi:MAG: superoxide dismutase, partial [Opitutales bacterium]|nr:superoxide dismutase [Opitutales bacterium]